MEPTSTKRHSGFVVGSTTAPRGEHWTVRVKDPESHFNGQKFQVASVHDNVALARGLNVTFLIGTVDGPSDEKLQKAVDVRIA